MNAAIQNRTNSNVNSLNDGLPQRQVAETTYHAQPYNLDACGFYFTSLEDYTAKAEANVDRWGAPVEEYELQLVDGTDAEACLFSTLRISQANLDTWFDVVDLDEREQAALAYLVGDLGYSLADALDKIDDVMLQEGSIEDVGADMFDELYLHEVPEHLHAYLDRAAWVRDYRLNGDLCETEFAGQTFTVTNANAL
ncbi:antirestriction protein ArdA [Burkholderia vietnamiensis]|uniref:antirestriction protein ArdA n=1 Tax=Burkholderia vietnamiensis TaxID=60552 RepID=UPI001594D45B|nr:hypothetical protein [Burkholderia vietnamiensis]